MADGAGRHDQGGAKCEGEKVMDQFKQHWKLIAGVWIVLATCLIVALVN